MLPSNLPFVFAVSPRSDAPVRRRALDVDALAASLRPLGILSLVLRLRAAGPVTSPRFDNTLIL